MDSICQISIILFGCSGAWLIGRTEHWSRWGYALGLMSEPFWIYTTLVHQQWGLFLISLWYTYSWGQGVWNYFIRPKRNKLAVNS